MSELSPCASQKTARCSAKLFTLYTSQPVTPIKNIISRYYWYVAFAAIVLGAIVSYLGAQIDGPAIAVLGFAPLMWALERQCFPGLLLGPFSFIYLSHILGYSIGPMWQFHIIGKLNGIESGMVQGQWGGVIGLLTIVVIFPVIFKWSERRFGPSRSGRVSILHGVNWKIYGLLLILAVGFRLGYGFLSGAGNRLGGLQGTSIESSSLVSALNPLQYTLFFFLGYLAAHYRGKWQTIWLVVFAAFAGFYFLDGGRQNSAYAAMFSGIGWVWGGASTRKVLLVGLLLLFAFVPMSGIVLNYRDTVRTANQPAGTQIDIRVKTLIETATEFSRSEAGSLASMTEAFARGITVFSVDRVFLLTPRIIPFAGLEGIENGLYALTPQIINPQRPELSDGNSLAILYGAAPPGTTGSYMPTVGDGYRRGGWLGIILLYAWDTIIFAVCIAICWTRRKRMVWMAMFTFLIYQSTFLWSTTMMSSFLLLLWIIPRSLMTFGLIGLIDRLLTKILYKNYFPII